MSTTDEGPQREGAGESQGGAYPNPHRGKPTGAGPGSFLGHGGQSDMDYEGPDNPNATKDETKEPEDGE